MVTNIAYPYTTHYSKIADDTTIAYIDEGAGDRTLLFVHGMANYAMAWKKNIDSLKNHYRCIAIDLPGNGLSDRNEHPFSIAFFAWAVVRIIENLRLTNVTIVGHSMGGQIALTSVLTYRGCADSLVLCAPAGFEVFSALDKSLYANTRHMFEFMTSDEQTLRQTIESSFYRQPRQGDGMVKELVALMKTYRMNYYRRMIDACITSMMNEPVYDSLNLVDTPALVIFGAKDALIPNKMLHHSTTEKVAADGVKRLRNATLLMLPDAGHFVQWEKADEVNAAIHKYLSGGK